MTPLQSVGQLTCSRITLSPKAPQHRRVNTAFSGISICDSYLTSHRIHFRQPIWYYRSFVFWDYSMEDAYFPTALANKHGTKSGTNLTRLLPGNGKTFKAEASTRTQPWTDFHRRIRDGVVKKGNFYPDRHELPFANYQTANASMSNDTAYLTGQSSQYLYTSWSKIVTV